MSISKWWREPCPKCGKKKHKKMDGDDIVCNNPDCDWKVENFFSEMIGINV